MIWIVFYSQTQAVRCRNVLAKNGIAGLLRKPPRPANAQHTCIWAVGIPPESEQQARQICLSHNVRPNFWMDQSGRVL